MIRRHLTVEGVVQGVGFRPYVYRLARAHGLSGSVRNDASGVEIEVEGEEGAVGRFVEALPIELPPMGSISRIVARDAPSLGEEEFTIVESDAGGERIVPVTPDAHLCDDCLRELRDPRDRRYRYPFINCTNCGPRFTIVVDVPYDRPNTTMAGFLLCEACRSEYEDPEDRRFHAQPVACPDCGPTVWLARPGDGARLSADDPIEGAREELRRGRVVAIKGVGGFHLAVDATNEDAVARLRERKAREGKPFALMAGDLDHARGFVTPTTEEARLLESVPRPIVLVERAPEAPLAPSVAPGLDTVGVMLAYSPLHSLLLEPPMPPLVMTSGNPSDEPIITSNEEAVGALSSLVDVLLLHDRPIQTGCDDSVAHVVRGRPRMIRRSRGYVPRPIEPTGLPLGDPILAVGGELKCALCVTRRRQLVVGRHLGDLTTARAYEAFVADVAQLSKILGVEPRVVAHDLHPDYRSTRFAASLEGVERVAVQHHHAHLASCLLENDVPLGESAVGVVLDGTGYGADGTTWGGELLVGSYASFERAAHLRAVPLPGGDGAIRSAWRSGLAYLLDAFGEEAFGLDLPLLRARPDEELEDLARMIAAGLNSPLSSGAGRLFDAAAAIIGVPSALADRVSYEAQAAMELEATARGEGAPYPYDVRGDEVDCRVTVRALVGDLSTGAPAALCAARFHATVARIAVEQARRLAEDAGLERVALSGGCFANRRLSSAVEAELESAGLEVLTHRLVPAGDGGLSLGQAAVAAAGGGER